MKKYFILLIAALGLLTGCEKEEFLAKYPGFEWYSSQEDEISLFVEVGDRLDFLDLSQNALSHTWEIQDGSFFLRPEFTPADTIYDEFIAGKELESTEKNISVLFTRPGQTTVRLANTFDAPVRWFNAEHSLEAEATADGLWLLDTTMTVDVFDKLAPAFKVLRNGEDIVTVGENDMPSADDASSWSTVELKEGDRLQFVNLTTRGRPTGTGWQLDNGGDVEVNGDTVEVAYNIVGEFEAGIMTTRRNGEGMPSSNVSKLIPLRIVVDYSTAPIVLDPDVVVSESEDGLLSVKVTGLVGDFSGKENHFTLHVSNQEAGVDRAIAVQTVRVNAGDATQLDITPAEPLYNSDQVTLTYDGLGNITNAAGFRELQAFGPVSVQMHFDPNAMNTDYSGYELEQTGGNNTRANSDGFYAQFNGGDPAVGPTYFWRDTDRAYSGNSSMRFNSLHADGLGLPFNRMQGNGFGSLSKIEEGTYRPSVWVYLAADNNMTVIEYNFLREGATVLFDVTDAPREEWVQLIAPAVYLTATPDNGRWDLNIRTDEDNNPDPAGVNQVFWVDQFELIPWEPRP